MCLCVNEINENFFDFNQNNVVCGHDDDDVYA